MKTISSIIQTTLFSSRWLLAPFFFCLVVALVAILVKMIQHTSHIVVHLLDAPESQVILDVLSLIDMCLAGSLVVLVIFSGFENFVSPIDHAEPAPWPNWMGQIDFTGLKLKLMSSIVAISAIQLLRAFTDLRNISDRDLAWYAGIHLTFVISALLLALSDKFSDGHMKPPDNEH